MLKDYVTVSKNVLELFELANDSKLDDIFDNIYTRFMLIGAASAYVTATVKTTTGIPFPNLKINEITDINGNSVVTDKNGVAKGYVSASTKSFSIPQYVDVQILSNSISLEQGKMYTKSLTVSTNNFKLYTASSSAMFSSNVKFIDYSLVAGGAGGSVANYTDYRNADYGGGGGGNAYYKEQYSVAHDIPYTISVGSGSAGTAFQTGIVKQGGSSSAFGSTVSGGTGRFSYRDDIGDGTGNGNGGVNAYAHYDMNNQVWVMRNATSGTSGNGKYYSAFQILSSCGGGGGGGYCISAYGEATAASGGYPGGGSGASSGLTSAGGAISGVSADSGVFPGGGGGGGAVRNVSANGTTTMIMGGNGANGCVSVCMHLNIT